MSTGSATFTTTHRVINRVHGNRTCARANASPTAATCLTYTFVHVIGIGGSSNGSHADIHYVAHFTRRHLQCSQTVFTGKQLNKSSCATSNRSTFTRLH